MTAPSTRPRPATRLRRWLRPGAAWFAATALLVTGAATAAPVQAQPDDAARPGAVQRSGDGARGTWSVRGGEQGPALVWRSPVRLPVTDARAEFRVGDAVVGFPALAADGRTLSLPVSALGGADPARVEVWLGSRRLDTVTQPPAPGRAHPGTPATGTVPGADPAEPGDFEVEAFDYTAADLPWSEWDEPLEVLGHAVLPVGVDDAPLVLFLHGRHYYCYGDGDTGDWPCADGSQPIPSYLGYQYLQELLASQGYATVSISANAVNAQDGGSWEGGARARGALVRRHLELLSAWTADPADPDWGGRLDPDRVVLVGHSRGGEGVNQGAIDVEADAPYRLRGQVLIAPTDFGYQTAPYLPTEVLLPYCDGDVYDLQGQRFVDAAPLLTDDDPALRSSVLLRGANHNFFNTEWTPGVSQAPSDDDWGDNSDPLCGKGKPTRLTAAEQRRVAMTYVTAGVHAFLGDDVGSALDYLDADEPVAIPEAGPALAWTHALGGDRVTARLGHGAAPAGAASACRAGRPSGEDDGNPVPLCGLGTRFYRQVHWTPADLGYASVHSADAASGLPEHAELVWTAAGAEGGVALSPALDLSDPGASLDLRTIADPRSGPLTVQVVLGSGAQSWAGPEQTLDRLPGGRGLVAVWAQTLRVDPADYEGHVDLSAVDRVLLRAVSDAGHVWLVDVSHRAPGLAPVPDRSLPRIRLGRFPQPEGDTDGAAVAEVPFEVLGTVTEPATFAVAADQWTFGTTGQTQPRFDTVTVEPGQTGGTIEVPYASDDRDDRRRQVQGLYAVPKHGLVTSGWQGALVVLDDDPAPDATFEAARDRIRFGGRIVLRLTLSEPTDKWVTGRLRAVREEGVEPLRTSDVRKRWLKRNLGRVPDDVPLAKVWKWGWIGLDPGETEGVVRIPTRSEPLRPGARVLTVRFRARGLLDGPVFVDVKVRPRR